MLNPDNNPFIPTGGQDPGMFLGIDPYVLLAGFIFSTIGLGAWYYGKRLELWKPKVIGVAMMLYPYFIYNRLAVWVIGIALSTTLWFQHGD